MDLQLNDKKALIVSASKGIGKGIALALNKEGCKVIICSSDLQNLSLAKREIEENSKKEIFTYQMDLSSEDSINESLFCVFTISPTINILAFIFYRSFECF